MTNGLCPCHDLDHGRDPDLDAASDPDASSFSLTMTTTNCVSCVQPWEARCSRDSRHH